MPTQVIPLERLNTPIPDNSQSVSQAVLENEINGVHVEHMVIATDSAITASTPEGHKSIYLFVQGEGQITAENTSYEVVPETIFIPNTVDSIAIRSALDNELHCVKVSCELSAQDLLDIRNLPADNTQKNYHAKFEDCQPYTEAIKSPNTVSRTILSNQYIPRVAMGTVQTKGPDKVAAHEHPMLEQLFLGLAENQCVVYADEHQVDFPQHSILHIPLGSRHSVAVGENQTLYYVWMDFFMDKEGEEWLKTHQVDTADQ